MMGKTNAKTNTMYGKLVTMLMAVVLLTMALCCTSTAENVNLLADLAPGFEEETLPEAVPLNGTAAVVSDAAHTGSKSVKLSTAGDYVRFKVGGLEPQTNYDFSFWMRNSVADSLGMYKTQNRFSQDGTLMEDLSLKPDWFVTGYGRLGDFFFGDAREGEAVNTWRKVTVNFTTPFEGCNGMHLTLTCAADDPSLFVDDLMLVKTGKHLGRAFNGDFEALDTSSDVPYPVGIDAYPSGVWGEGVTLEEDASTGNHYAHIAASDTNSSVVLPHLPHYMLGYAEGKRYKFSFKFKSPDAKAVPAIQFYDKNGNYFNNIAGWFPAHTVGEWETFTLYLNATTFKNTVAAADVVNKTVRFGNTKKEIYLDDLYSGFDNNSIGFYESFEFINNIYEETADRGTRFFSGKDANFASAFSGEKSVEAESLSALPVTDGYRTVITRAHVMPTEIMENGVGTGTFNKEEITLFTVVYKYEAGKKTLVDINIATDSSSDGKVMDAVGEVNVPVNTDTATYTVEAFAWNMSDMEPAAEKAVLE